jgi:hypothetical protein
LWLRHQPNSPLSIWFRERVGTAKGRIRRIAIVAVARKLLIALRLRRTMQRGVFLLPSRRALDCKAVRGRTLQTSQAL